MGGEVERLELHTGGNHKKGGTEELDTLVRIAHGSGMTQGETARHLGVSRWTVRKASERLGIEWPHAEATAAATKAAAAKARLDRADLLQRWTDLSHDLLDRAEQSGDPIELWAYAKPAAVATDKVVNLAALALREPEIDSGDDAARKLGVLFSGVHHAARLQELARKFGATEEQITATYTDDHTTEESNHSD